MDNASIKENIFRIRIEKGLSQDEMARKLGVVRNTYRKIEKGDLKLISEHIAAIADVFGISEEELVLGYKPAGQTGKLEDLRVDYDTRIARLTAAYENTICKLRKEIESKDAEIRDLRSMIEDKIEIISLLKRNNPV
ncbi:MAG: helix-turn-helix transcriptional regulator [Candidatus Cryptobacteroides sp.]